MVLKNMKLKKPEISTKLGVVIFGFTCFALIVAGWFYWFEWRPVSIKQSCYKNTFGRIEEWRMSNINGNKEWKPGKKWMPNPQQDKKYPEWEWWYPVTNDPMEGKVLYSKCLLEKGL